MAMDERTIKKMTDILKSNPKDMSAFKTLEEQYFLSHNWKKLSELYQFRADSIKRTDSAESARLYLKSGEIEEKRLGNKDQALKAYQNAFSIQPRNQEYGDILVNIYWVQENWQKALEILRRQLEFAQKPKNRVAFLLKISYIYKDKLQNKAEAKKSLIEVIKFDRTQQEALQFLEELYYQDEEWEELTNLYQISLQASTDPAVKKKLLERSALLCKEQLKDYAKAIQYYNQLFDLYPRDMNALRAMEDLYSRLGEWNQVIKVLRQQVDLIEQPPEKSKLMMRIAMLWSEKLHNVIETVRSYEEALQFHEDDMTLKLLEEMYVYQQNWKKLSDIYRRQAERLQDPQQKINIYCKIGALAKDYLSDAEMASKWYELAYRQGAKTLELIKILQDLYQGQGKTEQLIKTYYEEINLITDHDEKIILYNKIANIYHEQKNLRGTADIYEEILQTYPSHHSTLDSLKTLYLTMEDYPSLLRTLRREIALQPDNQICIPVYLKMADILKHKMGKEDAAIDCYCKILEIDSSRLDVWQYLYHYYKREENYPQLMHVLENIAQLDYQNVEVIWMEWLTCFFLFTLLFAIFYTCIRCAVYQ